MSTGFQQRIAQLSPGAKRGLMLSSLGAAVLVAFLILKSSGVGSERHAPVSADNLLTNADPRALGLGSLNDAIGRQQRDVSELKATVDKLLAQRDADAKTIEELKKSANQRPPIDEPRITAPASTATSLPTGPLVQPAGTVPGITEGPAAVGQERFSQRQQQLEAMRQSGRDPMQAAGEGAPLPERRPAAPILTIGGAAPKKDADAATTAVKDETKEPAKDFIPAGSIITAVLLNGMDAPTGRSAQSQPLPVLARVKSDAILPNRFRSNVRECRIVGSAWGDLSSERAFIRSEVMSCVRADGAAIEVKVKMFATGEDGKFGLRGPVIEKRGSMIGRAALAGFLQGISTAFQPQRIPVLATSAGSDQQFQSPSGSEAGRAAGYGGVAGAADRLADYYIKRADELVPVIEISAGREVTFVVQEGKELVSRNAP